MNLRCAYLVSRYPAITHTFILTEIRALREQGAEIHTASIRRAPCTEVLAPEDEREHSQTYALLPTTPAKLLGAHGRAFGRSPLGYLRTLLGSLRLSPGGTRAGLWRLFYFGEAILLWDWLEEKRLRHVHVHFANVASDVAMLATRFGNAAGGGERWTWSLTLHGPLELLDMHTHRIAAKVRSADLVVCTSDFVRSQLMGLVDQDYWPRLRTARCGIDTRQYHPREGSRNGDLAEPVTILNVAGMSRRKGHELLLDALADLRDRGIPFRAVLVGDGEERPRLERHAAELGLTGAQVHFAGALGQGAVPAEYRKADIFALPSYAEGVPTVLMEAMASGLPVVGTHVMGVPELIEHNRSGLLIPPARADALADALARLAQDPGLRARLGQAARERVDSEFELRRAATGVGQAIKGAVAG